MENAIQEGENTETVSREQIFLIFNYCQAGSANN